MARVNVFLPDELLEAVDEAVAASRINRSALIQMAIVATSTPSGRNARSPPARWRKRVGMDAPARSCKWMPGSDPRGARTPVPRSASASPGFGTAPSRDGNARDPAAHARRPGRLGRGEVVHASRGVGPFQGHGPEEHAPPGALHLALPEFAARDRDAIRFSDRAAEADVIRALSSEKLRLEVVSVDWDLLRKATTTLGMSDRSSRRGLSGLGGAVGVPFPTADEVLVKRVQSRGVVIRLGDLESDRSSYGFRPSPRRTALVSPRRPYRSSGTCGSRGSRSDLRRVPESSASPARY